MSVVVYLCILLQNPLLINNEFKEADLIKHIDIYRDSVQHNLNEILDIYNDGLFKLPPDKDIAYSPGPYYYFLHYTVKNNSAHSKSLYFEIRNPHLNRIQLFQSDKGRYKNSILTGDYYPFKQREIKHRFFVFETELAPGEEKEFFLFTDKYNESIKIPIIVRTKDSFIESSNYSSSMLGYYFGAILIILLASIIISVISPRRLNFLFIIYLLGFSLFTFSHTGLGYQFLWSNTPLFNSLSRSFFAMVTNFTILTFAYYFFDMKYEKGWLKKTHWAITFYIAINWVFHIIYYSLIYYNHSLHSWINYKYLQAGVFLFPVYLLALIIYQIVRKNRLKYYLFLISSLGMLGAVGVMMLGQIGIVKDHFILENITLIGLIVDFTILAGILSSDLYNIKLNNQKLITSLDQAIADGAKNFLKGQQNERARLSQEIHDGTGVRLSAIQMKLSSIETENNTQRDNILNDLSIVSRDLRKFSHNLSSVVLEKFGLINAIEELVLSLEQVYPDFTFVFEYGIVSKIDDLKEKELYFIINELINNTIKHSKGNKIGIHIKANSSALIVEYQDNGIGIDLKKKSNGLGLTSIEWRINILSGTMNYTQEHGINKFMFVVPF